MDLNLRWHCVPNWALLHSTDLSRYSYVISHSKILALGRRLVSRRFATYRFTKAQFPEGFADLGF